MYIRPLLRCTIPCGQKLSALFATVEWALAGTEREREKQSRKEAEESDRPIDWQKQREVEEEERKRTGLHGATEDQGKTCVMC